MFRVFVPGVGNIFVNAGNAQEAITGVLRYLEQNNLANQLPPGTTDNLQATAFNPASLPQGSLVIGSEGTQAGGSGTPEVVAPENPPAVAQPTMSPGGGTPGGPNIGDNQQLFPATTPNTGGGASLAPTPEEVSPQGAFRNFLRSQGLNPDSILGGTVASQFRPFLDTHGLNQVLHNLGAGATEGGGSLAEQIQQFGGPQSFVDFVRQQGSGGIANTALGALQGVAGQGPGQENTFLAALQQASPTNALGDILQNVASQALRTRLSPAALGLFGNSAFNLANQRFEDQLAGAAAGGGTAPTFAQHLLRSLGLS